MKKEAAAEGPVEPPTEPGVGVTRADVQAPPRPQAFDKPSGPATGGPSRTVSATATAATAASAWREGESVYEEPKGRDTTAPAPGVEETGLGTPEPSTFLEALHPQGPACEAGKAPEIRAGRQGQWGRPAWALRSQPRLGVCGCSAPAGLLGGREGGRRWPRSQTFCHSPIKLQNRSDHTGQDRWTQTPHPPTLSHPGAPSGIIREETTVTIWQEH